VNNDDPLIGGVDIAIGAACAIVLVLSVAFFKWVVLQ
jgi:hypothetical protein